MSTPDNPLAQYHTYSYHHIFMVCDTSETAAALNSSNNFITFMRDPSEYDETDPYTRYRPRTILQEDGEEGKYSIIINGMTDAEFVISEITWNSVIDTPAGPNGYSRFTTYASTGQMTVEEPRGIRFMNVMAEVAKSLGSDPNGLIYVVKTIFVGHPSDQAFNDPDQDSLSYSGVYDPITNIRPLLLTLHNITGRFKVTGGTYVISFAATNQGTSKQSHIMRAAKRLSLNFGSTGEGRSLASGLNKFQRLINHDYKKYFNNIKERVENTKDQNNNPVKFNGKMVEYIIQAEEPYVKNIGTRDKPKYVANGDYTITDFKSQNTEKGKTDEPGIISFGQSASIEDAISSILHRCKKVKEDLAGSDDQDTGLKMKYIPKVSSDINITTEKYQVIFKVRRMLVPTNDLVTAIQLFDTNRGRLDNINIPDREQFKDIERNTLQLDYIFTGQNTDIIDMDIKMDQGMTFFQTLLTTDTIPDPMQSAVGSGPPPKYAEDECLSKHTIPVKTPKDEVNPLENVNPNTPIFSYTTFNDRTTKNTTTPRLTASYQQLLNRQGGLENLAIKVKIHGNSGLLNSTNSTPEEEIKRTNRLDTDADKRRDLFPYWETTPAIVKLDIRMPAGDDDLDFTAPFWYEGFYRCHAIVHKFENGEFTQELTLMSLPQIGEQCPPQQNSKEQTEQDEQTDANKAAATSAKSTGTDGKAAGSGGTGSSSPTSSQSGDQTTTPADLEPEELPVSDYLRAYFKDQIIPGCKV